MHTEADEKLDSAAEHLKAAYKDISEVVVDKCWGTDEYTSEYLETTEEVMITLLSLQRKLGRRG